MPTASLSLSTATTATSETKWNSSRIAEASACAPAGLCAASTRIVGALRSTSSRPGEPTRPNASPDRVGVDRHPATAEERLDRRHRHRRVLCLVRAVQRQEELLVRPGRGPARRAAGRRRRPPAPHAELDALPGDRGADLGRAGEQDLRRLAWLSAITASEPGLMIPAFSVAMSPTVSPRYSAWSSAIGVRTATLASATLVASHAPPMPTSTTATSTGASANVANAIAVSTSK